MHAMHRTSRTSRTSRISRISRISRTLVIAAALAAVVGAVACEPTEPAGQRIEWKGQVYYLRGQDLLDARGRVVYHTPVEIMPGLQAAISGNQRLKELDKLETIRRRSLSTLSPHFSGPGTQQGDVCRDAFNSLYTQTQSYKVALWAYWQAYFALAGSINDQDGYRPPSPSAGVSIVQLGIDIISKRTALDVLATEIRAWGCL